MSPQWIVRSRGELVSFLAAPSGARVRCHSGQLWVTVDGDTTDYVLGPGQSFEARGGAHVVVEALGPSALEVQTGDPASAAA